MNNLKCKKCKNLQFKYQLIGARLEIEIKCHKCNEFNKFVVSLPQIIKNYEKNNK